MRYGRRGSQTRRKRRGIRWGRVLAFILSLAMLLAAIGFIFHMLSGEDSPLTNMRIPDVSLKSGQ